MKTALIPAVILSTLSLFSDAGLRAQDPAAAAPTVGDHGEAIGNWSGYKQLSFTLAGHGCLLVVPKTPLPGNPWIWRTEFFGAFAQADVALLGKGVYVAYMDMTNMYGAPPALDLMDKFYDHLTSSDYGLSPKVTLEGFSRGGLFAFNWAARNPAKVACMYVDAPVCDIKSWPGGKGKGVGSPDDWTRLKAIYGLSEDQALAFQHNPIDNLQPLADAHIDILSVCGGADKTVPEDENTDIVADRYKAMGGNIKVISKPGCDHHPHSLDDPTPIVDFVLDHSKQDPMSGLN